ncbi:MAG: tRNA pseudouridine(38-40) synthase TruA [Solirubrobacterales bacterium]|nr:tRNA pseudouridine(38-40) synthase TruA [Solirubrobacterales bacterium]
MARYRLDIEYDGTPFHGWAKQEGVETVQAHLERALEVALRHRPIELTVAGRTDAGVHALGQVASFEFEGELPEMILRSLNGLTPREISVRGLSRAPAGFNARRDARARTYLYRMLTRRPDSPFSAGRAWWVSRPLDIDRLHDCAAVLVGEHDFTAFTPSETYHTRFERTIHSAAWQQETGPLDPATGNHLETDILEFWITGDSFMQNMVRILVGTMIEVADGSRTVAEFRRLLEGAKRVEAGVTAPPQGLFLVAVEYREPDLAVSYS